MRIFVAGATGVLGRRLVRRFHERGHAVVGLVRGREGERAVEAAGGTARFADLFDTAALVHAAAGCHAVVHAATAIPQAMRPRLRDWETNDRIRRQGTAALAACAAAIGARQFVFQSIVWAFRPADDGPFDEDAPPSADPLYRSAVDGEQIAREAAERAGFAAAVVRCGMFYAADAAHTRMMIDGLRRRRMPIVGSGDAVWRLVHVDDAAEAFLTVVESGRAGTWHVVDDLPATAQQVCMELAARLGARPPRHVPLWLARLVAGRSTVEFFTRSTRTSAARLQRDLSWQPRYPSYREGFDQVVRALEPV